MGVEGGGAAIGARGAAFHMNGGGADYILYIFAYSLRIHPLGILLKSAGDLTRILASMRNTQLMNMQHTTLRKINKLKLDRAQ